jgi:hypothetical protein
MLCLQNESLARLCMSTIDPTIRAWSESFKAARVFPTEEVSRKILEVSWR